ncbi:MAG TPA: cellulase family glycosylhydrolase, partial [Polyangiaceae bacterium]|nr:cellulase family glycosylhydrolase [Polyangiaceae bacterium]
MAGRLSKTMASCVGVAFASVSCGDAEPSPPVETDSFVATNGVLKDAMGREVILRGINARVRGIFDVDFDDGRTSLETIPPFVEEDCRFIAEELGMNHLRLPVNWSALEPVKGQYDEAQLAEIVSLAEACDRHGVQTLVDLHQDAYSKEIGEDGAPLWAIVPPPTELLEGPLDDLSARRTSAQVLDAFDHFFNDAEGVETAYAKMAGWLAAGIADKPGIVGLELMNEPVLIVFEGRLDDFHDRVAAEVRKAAPSLTVFFEPNSTRNLTDRADVRRPVAFDDAVYAPHLYVD